jgi:hypothetical protein
LHPEIKRLFLRMFTLLVVVAAITAQTPTGALSGIVTGPSGTAAARVKVSVKNVATNQITDAQSDAAGRYTVSTLEPGEYVVAASSEALS